MHFIRVFLLPVFVCTFAASVVIISVDNDIVDNAKDGNDFPMENSSSIDSESVIIETVYARQSYGKSHRFYFNVGERIDGDKLLDERFKQTGWKTKTDAQVNVTFDSSKSKTPNVTVTYVAMIVYQESDINRIRVVNGAINTPVIGINIVANQTRYLTYKAQFYGK